MIVFRSGSRWVGWIGFLGCIFGLGRVDNEFGGLVIEFVGKALGVLSRVVREKGRCFFRGFEVLDSYVSCLCDFRYVI